MYILIIIGVKNRGVSNSIASPGVSVLFGGGPSYTDTRNNETVKSYSQLESAIPKRNFEMNQVPVATKTISLEDTHNQKRSQSSEQNNGFRYSVQKPQSAIPSNRVSEQPSQIAKVADSRFNKMEKTNGKNVSKRQYWTKENWESFRYENRTFSSKITTKL